MLTPWDFMKPDRDEAIRVPSHFESDSGRPIDRASSALDMRAQQSDSPFKPGWSCWRVEPARRAAFLIDGHAYFAAFREAALASEHSIYMLGWDFDSRIRMMIGRESDGYPDRLGPFLAPFSRGGRSCIFMFSCGTSM
ncbi:MAG: hypothetical protein OJF50_002700 [Nitrospira sp.]|jgi:phosphatidylserine/phosphatidylglycerophosphate/cardiolipin synthase-like enzyme|nr:hypothetical protein [Nitrospira sp.]